MDRKTDLSINVSFGMGLPMLAAAAHIYFAGQSISAPWYVWVLYGVGALFLLNAARLRFFPGLVGGSRADEWLSLSAQRAILHEAHDKGFKFLFLRVPRATFSTTSPDPINVAIGAEWKGPGGESEVGTAINEVSVGAVAVSDDSPAQVKDLRYILSESKWENLLSDTSDLDDLTAYLVATDIQSGRIKSWDLGDATRDGEREIQLTPLDLRIETGRTYIEEVEHSDYQYTVVVEDCILTNRTGERMNLSGSLIVEYEGGWKYGTEALEGVRDTPGTPFTVDRDSWTGDLAFGFRPRTLVADRPEIIGDGLVHATLEFRDSRSPGRYATKKVAFKLSPSLRLSDDDT